MNAQADTMTTLEQEHSHSAAYWGGRGQWLIAAAVHRDSGTLERANWQSFAELLGGESDTVAIERSSHWAVGWVDYLVIDPADTERVRLAEEARRGLEDYPVLDEQALSRLEWDEYQEAWDNWGAGDFVRALKGEFALSDSAADTLRDWDGLMEWYESLISSGEYYIAESSGVSINIRSAIFHAQRENVAQAIRNARNS